MRRERKRVFEWTLVRSQRRPGPPTGRKPGSNARETPWAFLLSELIGERVRVTEAAGKDLRGLEGRIIDETRGTLLVETAKGRRRIPKSGTRFVFPELSEREVPGEWLLVRPEDRIKRLSARLARA